MLRSLGLPNIYCELCNKALATMDSVKAHKLTVHAKICVCSFCGKPYKNKYILKTHTNSVHKGKKVIDDSSDVKTNQFENDDEKKTENSQPLFELKYVQTKEVRNNTATIRESNSPTKYSVDLVDNVAVSYDICHESFENMDELDTYIEKGHKVAKEELEEKNSQKTSQHMKRVHKGLKKFHISSTHRSNDSMGNDFYRNGHANTDDFVTKGLNKLVKRGIVIPILKFKDNELDTCIKCMKKFKFKRNFQIHNKSICGQEKRVHEGVKAERIYKCTQCDKNYTQSQNLKAHIKFVHQKLKEYSCKLCNKNYTQSHSLKNHIKSVHQGLKKYSSTLCEKSYTQSPVLKTHIKRVHEGIKAERVFKCATCDKSYTQSHSLKIHIAKLGHEAQSNRFRPQNEGIPNEANFSCNLCNGEFVRKKTFLLHMKSVHEGVKMESNIQSSSTESTANRVKKIRCKLCDKTYTQSCKLKSHLKRVHEGQHIYKKTIHKSKLKSDKHNLISRELMNLSPDDENNPDSNIIEVEKESDQDPDITLDETLSGLSNDDIQILSQHESESHIRIAQNVHEGEIVVSENIDRNLVHEDMKTETNNELISTSDESTLTSHNNVKIDHEDKFQGSCQYCGWSGANSDLMLVIHTKNFHQEEIDLDKAFEAEVKAGLVEPLDC